MAWVNSGTYIGEAEPIYTADRHRKPRVKKLADGTYQAEVDFTWAVDGILADRGDRPHVAEMTEEGKAAVAKFKSALRAHEVMHFDVTDKIIKALPKTVKATGSGGAGRDDQPADGQPTPTRSRHQDGDRHGHHGLRQTRPATARRRTRSVA